MTIATTPRRGASRRALIAAAAGAALARPAFAQEWPTRPLRIIVPYTPGGTTDIATRLVAEPLSRVLGQPVVVENRPGANSIVGAAAAATSAPDGYTLVMVLPAHAANATLQAGKMPFDALTSFAPVSLVVQAPLVLAGSRHVPAEDFRGFVDYIRARPGRVNYGSSGIGATAHLAMEQLAIITGVRMTHIPYRGTSLMLPDLLGGQIELAFENTGPALPHIKSGALVALGFATPKRLDLDPGLPTIAETLPGFEATAWHGMLAPIATPAPIVERLAAEIKVLANKPATIAKLAELGAIAQTNSSPKAFGDFIADETQRWKKVIETAGIKPT